MQYLDHAKKKKTAIVYLKFKFNKVSWILFGNSHVKNKLCKSHHRFHKLHFCFFTLTKTFHSWNSLLIDTMIPLLLTLQRQRGVAIILRFHSHFCTTSPNIITPKFLLKEWKGPSLPVLSAILCQQPQHSPTVPNGVRLCLAVFLCSSLLKEATDARMAASGMRRYSTHTSLTATARKARSLTCL